MSAPARSTMPRDPQQAAELLRAVAHPTRLQILCRLLDGELAVAGFEAELGLKQPSLSQQLGQLREAGLVATRREAKSVFYRLADPRVAILLDALRRAFDHVAPSADRRTDASPPAAPNILVRRPSAPSARLTAGAAECGVFPVVGRNATTGRRS